MKTLHHHIEASDISNAINAGRSIFVQILDGKKAGSIAKVISVSRIHFSRHLYRLSVDGHRPFSESGKNLIISDETDTKLITHTRQDGALYRDSLDQVINLNDKVIFWKNNDLWVGIANKITEQGIDVSTIHPTVGNKSTIRRTSKIMVLNDEIETNLLARVLANADN